MGVFYFVDFGILKHVHHTTYTLSGFQRAATLNSKKAASVMTHLLEGHIYMMAIMGIAEHIKTDNAPECICSKMASAFSL